MVVGIKSYKVNLPRRVIKSEQGQTQVSILGPDEDIFTLGANAALKMSGELDQVRSIFFATTLSPFVDRSLATQLCSYLNLGDEVTCYDLQGSRRSGTQALFLAMERVRPGEDSLVVISDGGTKTSRFRDDGYGYGAVAFLLSSSENENENDLVATLLSRSVVQNTIYDEWQMENGSGVYARHHHGDHRFARTQGYEESMSQALKKVMTDLGWQTIDIDRCVIYSPDVKSGAALLKRHGFDLKRHYSDFISARWGLTGAAHSSLMMAAELERSQSGDRLLALNYGDGSDASIWKIHRVSEQRFLDEPSMFLTSDQFSKLSQTLEKAHETTPGFTSEIMEHRNRNLWQKLFAKQCLKCETILTLPLPVCPQCGLFEWKNFPLARTGECYSITWEHYYPAQESPQGMAVIRLDGGGQLTLQVADALECKDDDRQNETSQRLDVDDRVELVLRRVHNLGDRPGYFWKCRKINEVTSQKGGLR